MCEEAGGQGAKGTALGGAFATVFLGHQRGRAAQPAALLEMVREWILSRLAAVQGSRTGEDDR